MTSRAESITTPFADSYIIPSGPEDSPLENHVPPAEMKKTGR